jgi:hypothetical protein
VIELARSHTTDAIKTLVAAMNSDRAPWAARIAAANAILDCAFGRPKLGAAALASYMRRTEKAACNEEAAAPSRADRSSGRATCSGTCRTWRNAIPAFVME